MFEKDIRPLLKAHCFHCHGEAGKKEGGVDLRLRRFMLKTTDEGPVMEPGNSEASLIVQLTRNGEMPKGAVVAFDLAVLPWAVRADEFVCDGVELEQLAEPPSVAVAPGVVGHEPLDRDAVAGEELDRSGEELGGCVAFLVGKDL